MSFELGPENIAKMTEYGIPEYMHGGLIRYFENHIEPGDFLTAVLENDLMAAIGHADDNNKQAINSYVVWLYNCAPARASGSWGSRDAVTKWLNNSGTDDL